ncbi:CAAX protease family protein [Marchantia polymorpha subsp. ruderalis]|uniref:CAAX prenyl protease 2/Lysostaphin resistance protein A-like domain-containing protein n=2 Tax=Marchantia polymorpha TaxID=3197 RepID=A0AAF6AU01_MARPO|nr:hypothetical protein MARPO_0061s0039 [Marchantia polymorpha]BBM99921.1 hypothetical protein Mp_1g24840 [Marchantia polymorpha subsp. ruderalis]|eukprot:PTQ36765.1 hypothetical protein MARPO_0061s0039 [Marchantia polymorpha]
MRAMPGIAMGPSCQAVVKLQREIGRARICSGVLLACGLRPNWQRHSDFTPSSHGLLDAPGFELSRKGRRRSQMRACDHGSSRKDSNAAESNASSAAAVEDVTEVAHAASLLCLQSLEALAATWLVQSTVQEHDDAIAGRILEPQFSRVLRNRGWLPTSVLCLIGLLLVVVATSSTAACAPKHGDSVVEFVTAGGMSRTGIIAVSCLITPYLEEYMYRGFLLTSLAAYFGWPAGVLASSVVFVLAHLPLAAGGQALGLLFTGCVLGVSFVYTGNLATSLVIHSLYNATLLLALSSSSSC